MTDVEFAIAQGAKFPYDASDAWHDAYPKVAPIPATDWAHTAARAIIHDLKDRAGVDDTLGNSDEDTRQEIITVIAEIIRYCANMKDVP